MYPCSFPPAHTLHLSKPAAGPQRKPVWSALNGPSPAAPHFGQGKNHFWHALAPIIAGIGIALSGFGTSIWSQQEKKAVTHQIETLQSHHDTAKTQMQSVAGLLVKMKNNRGSFSWDWVKQRAAEMVFSKDEKELRQEIFKLFSDEQYAQVELILNGLAKKEAPTEQDFRAALVDFVQLAGENKLQPEAQTKLSREIAAVKAFDDSLKSFQFPAFEAPKGMVDSQQWYNNVMWTSLVVGLLASLSVGGGISFSVIKT